MVTLARGLSDEDLAAVAGLEARVVAADGGRLKLEWTSLKARAGDQVRDLLWWENGRLLGFVGLYGSGEETIEIAGMVDAVARRRGIATALLDAALPLCHARGWRRALLVTPRASVAGRTLALGRGAVLDHSEHALVLTKPPSDGPTDPVVALRPATAADLPVVTRILAAGFGEAPTNLASRLTEPSARMLVVEHDGLAVGTLRVTSDGDAGAIHGFAIDPGWQRRGIGRDVLRRVCRRLQDEGVRQIGLEVEVGNDHALALYTTLGFSPLLTEDYYALALDASDLAGSA